MVRSRATRPDWSDKSTKRMAAFDGSRMKEEKALRAVIDPVHLPELDISLGTGMRLSEQFELTWEQVDFVRHEVRLSKTKNFSGRSIPMNRTVEAAFKKIKSRAATTKRGEKVFAGYPRKWWEDAISKSGIVSYRWHNNRHTFCSWLAMAGVSLKEIQVLAGAQDHHDGRTLRASLPGGFRVSIVSDWVMA